MPRSEIAKHAGVCPKTALDDITKMGIKVIQNKLILKRIKPENVDNLPSLEEAKESMKQGLLPQGIHIRDGFGENGKAYPFGREGALAAIKSGTRTIFIAMYPMNTYDATKSPFNPYPAKILSEEEQKDSDICVIPDFGTCSFMNKNYERCSNKPVGSGNPFCKKHSGKPGNSNQKRRWNTNRKIS